MDLIIEYTVFLSNRRQQYHLSEGNSTLHQNEKTLPHPLLQP